MNGIGNAFIWTAIACGPFFLLLLGVMTLAVGRHRIVRARAGARHLPGANRTTLAGRAHRA